MVPSGYRLPWIGWVHGITAERPHDQGRKRFSGEADRHPPESRGRAHYRDGDASVANPEIGQDRAQEGGTDVSQESLPSELHEAPPNGNVDKITQSCRTPCAEYGEKGFARPHGLQCGLPSDKRNDNR